jgi:hypothetical protein
MILYGDHTVERRLDQDWPQPRLAHQPPDGRRDSPRRLSDLIWDTLHPDDDRRPVIAAARNDARSPPGIRRTALRCPPKRSR